MEENINIGIAFLGGMLSFASPCIIPLMPVYIGILSDRNENSSYFKIFTNKIYYISLLKTLAFMGGISISFMILGFGAGALGSLINSSNFIVIMGLLIIILGIHQMDIFKIPFLEKEKKLKIKRSNKGDIVGTFLLGFSFSFGWTPCIGPVLGAVMGLSASQGATSYGVILMLVYSLGLSIPFLIISMFSEILLDRVKLLNKHMGIIKKIGGGLIVIMGLYMIINN